MPSTRSSAPTKCISDVPGLAKQTSTPPFSNVRTRLSAPLISSSPLARSLHYRPQWCDASCKRRDCLRLREMRKLQLLRRCPLLNARAASHEHDTRQHENKCPGHGNRTDIAFDETPTRTAHEVGRIAQLDLTSYLEVQHVQVRERVVVEGQLAKCRDSGKG